jgi:hypothetical protein
MKIIPDLTINLIVSHVEMPPPPCIRRLFYIWILEILCIRGGPFDGVDFHRVQQFFKPPKAPNAARYFSVIQGF